MKKFEYYVGFRNIISGSVKSDLLKVKSSQESKRISAFINRNNEQTKVNPYEAITLRKDLK